MKPATQDSIAHDSLQWAFSGKRQMTQSQRDRVSEVCRRAKLENYESPGKRRSRLWGLGPVWAKRYA